MKIKPFMMAILFILSGIVYYGFLEDTTLQKVLAVRVIDGDTFEINTGQKVRLKGINTPETSMPFYSEAKNYLRDRIEGREIEIKHYGTGRYNRLLAHVFLDGIHINKKILEKGFGTLYYYGEDEYYNELKKAENSARENQRGIWEKSKDAECLELVQLKYKEDSERCSNEEVLELKNSCDKKLKILIKDDATHIYNEIIKPNSIFKKNYSCIWNDDGDSLYVYDNKGGVLLFHRY